MLTNTMFRKIHFIKVYDFNYINAGDIFCSPYIWFYDFFKSYSCLSHSLSSVRYEQIAKKDIVIIGGGGLINYNPWMNFNIEINKILSLCENVIVWGAGYNSRVDDGKLIKFEPEVDFSRFKLYGIRDYQFANRNYVPCSSCMNPLLKQIYEAEPKEQLGSMLHPLMDTRALPIKMANLSHFENIESIMEFIGNHETIITNSYHCALWAMMANRKVVSPRGLLFGNKFYYFRNTPSFCNDWTNKELLLNAIKNAKKYPDFLDESIKITLNYFEKVKSIIYEVIPNPNKSYEAFYQQSLMAEYFWKLKLKRL